MHAVCRFWLMARSCMQRVTSGLQLKLRDWRRAMVGGSERESLLGTILHNEWPLCIHACTHGFLPFHAHVNVCVMSVKMPT
jgi:hypothetical protein